MQDEKTKKKKLWLHCACAGQKSAPRFSRKLRFFFRRERARQKGRSARAPQEVLEKNAGCSHPKARREPHLTVTMTTRLPAFRPSSTRSGCACQPDPRAGMQSIIHKQDLLLAAYREQTASLEQQLQQCKRCVCTVLNRCDKSKEAEGRLREKLAAMDTRVMGHNDVLREEDLELQLKQVRAWLAAID